MARSRFVDPEPLTADGAVEKVWDTLHQRHRVRRRLWNLPRSEWEEARERFRDLAQLSSPSLPRLVAVGEEDRVLTLVEDYVEGETLGARIDAAPPDMLQTIQLLVPIVHAVGAMHELFMGHGGIDMGSIVIDGESGRAFLVGAGAREALPDMDFDALSEVIVRAIVEPTDDSRALVQDLRTGKLRDCSKVVDRLMQLVPEGELPEGVAGLDDAFGFTEPLQAEVEAGSKSDGGELDFDWPAMADDLETQRRADDRKMLRWFVIGTAAIALIGLAAAIDLGSAGSADAAQEPPDGPVEFANINDAALDGAGDVRRVDGLGKWRVERVDGGRHPITVVSLEAENGIRDRLGRSGRPTLHIRCADEQVRLTVSPGVDTVEAIVADDATYARHADLAFTWEGFPTDHVSADFRPEGPDLDLRDAAAVLSDAPRSESLYLSYTPFASDAVVAIFDVRGMDRALGALDRFCTLP